MLSRFVRKYTLRFLRLPGGIFRQSAIDSNLLRRFTLMQLQLPDSRRQC